MKKYIILLLTLAVATTFAQQFPPRVAGPSKAANYNSYAPMSSITVNPGVNAPGLVQAILGPTINYVGGSAVLTAYSGGSPYYYSSSGTFDNGTAAGLGFNSGIILSSGYIQNAIGPNDDPATTAILGLPADADLTALSGHETADATILEFDFTTNATAISIQFEFGSEEYNEWVGSKYNDAFGFYIDGQNIALVPGTSYPISVNSINNGSNAAYYINNDAMPGPLDIECDGLTVLMSAVAVLNGGPTTQHHVKLAISDASDAQLDSWVFFKHAGFTPALPVNLGADFILCDGSATTLDAGNWNGTYFWSTGATSRTITVSTPGHYTCTVITPDGAGFDDVNVLADNEPPEITCPTVQPTYNADNGKCSASLSFAATATDNCGISGYKYYLGTTEIFFPYDFPVGTTEVKTVATDTHGLTDDCSFNVTVVDNQKPVLTGVPADALVNCPIPGPAAVTASDNCSATLNYFTTPTVLAKLVHLWKADNNYLDAAGGANGTPHYNVGFGPGIIGSNAFSFNGSLGYISTGTAGSVSGTADFAVSAWVKTTSTDPMMIINQRDGNFYGEYILKIGSNHSNNVFHPGLVYFLVYGDGSPDIGLFSTIPVNDGKWHHLVGERSGTEVRIYIDGLLNVSGSTVVPVALNGSITTTIGKDVRDYYKVSNFNGLIDDVKVWFNQPCPNKYDFDRVWTATDASGNQAAAIQHLIVQDVTPPVITCPPDLVLCYPNRNDPTGEATATDNCPGPITITSDKPAELSIGENFIHWTATDVCGNPSTCTQKVTVSGEMAVEISESLLPEFCQGEVIQLTANVTGTPAVSYSWTPTGNTPTIKVGTSGIYSVTVTDAKGCTASSSYTATVSITDLLSSYVMLTRNHIKLEQTTVLSGGLGVKGGKDAKIEAKHSSLVTAAGTFAKANHITVDNSSVITTKILSPATIPWPAFEEMTGNGTINVTVPNNATMTVSGSLYKEIKIGKNATLIFTAPVVDISKKLTMEEGATLDFNQCTTLHMKEKLEAKKNVTINPGGLSIVFYIDDDVKMEEGAHVTGVFYLGDANAADTAKHHMHIGDSKVTNPATFNGMFLAECIHSGKYTTWNMNPNCNFCTRSAITHFEQITPVTEQEIMLKNYPNPFTGKTDIVFMLPADNHVSLDVYDISGRFVQNLFNGDIKMNQEYKFEFSGITLSSGTYIYKLTTNDGVLMRKMILMK